MPEDDRVRWDQRYAGSGYRMGDAPRPWLVGAAGWLPPSGTAVDLACGEGQCAVWLAERGLEVTGIDLSPVGLAKARALAEARGVSDAVDLVEADLVGWWPGDTRWDVVTCFQYLDRALIPAVRRSVRPGGLVVMEVLAGDPGRRRFRAERGELLRWFVDWGVLRFEEGPATSAIVARRPG